MRFAKLLGALRARTPDARVAHSILGYRVGQAELDAVFHHGAASGTLAW
jgi:hypothetical protein